MMGLLLGTIAEILHRLDVHYDIPSRLQEAYLIIQYDFTTEGHVSNARGVNYVQRHAMFQLLAYVNATLYTSLFQSLLIHILKWEKPGRLPLFIQNIQYVNGYL